MGILHFKHSYFVVLKHELHMSASLELVTESLARQAAIFFSSTLLYACFEGIPLEKYIKIIFAFDSVAKDSVFISESKPVYSRYSRLSQAEKIAEPIRIKLAVLN